MNGRSFEPYPDRVQAGVELARALEQYRGSDALVLGVPRGGVVVAYEVARILGLEMDVVVPRKIGAPGQPELAIGAVSSWGNGHALIDERTSRYLGVTREYIEAEVARQSTEVDRRLMAYRGTTEPPNMRGRSVILVDDGVATGYTTRASLAAVRRLGARDIVLAVPVGAPDSCDDLRQFADRVICLKTPSPFAAVGNWYRRFDQTTDSEVVELLAKHRKTHRQSPAHP
jgi:putative phosphoribosyl transferase